MFYGLLHMDTPVANQQGLTYISAVKTLDGV